MNEFRDEITLLKALAHPARLAILEALRGGEACVCHMEALFGWRQAYLSQQLMVLREAGLVADRREGWNVYYRVVRPEIFAVLDALQQAVPARETLDLPAFVSACTCPRCQGKASRSAETFRIGEIKTTS